MQTLISDAKDAEKEILSAIEIIKSVHFHVDDRTDDTPLEGIADELVDAARVLRDQTRTLIRIIEHLNVRSPDVA